MGTDIHIFTEVRKKGKWENIEKYFICDDRNYDLFAILADVRNGTHSEEFIPISKPKGLPWDISNELEEYFENHYCLHSRSWLTLKELIEYDWEQTIKHYDIISEDEYIKIKNLSSKGHPDTLIGNISGPNIVVVDESTMDNIIKNGSLRLKDKKYYVKTLFDKETYRECCLGFYNKLKTLKELIPKDGTEEDVRIVFAFDN